MKKIAVILIISVWCCIKTAYAQEPEAALVKAVQKTDNNLSGNKKDALKNFFQLGFEHLIGNKKELTFSASPFAALAKLNPELLVNDNYTRYKNLRRLNFDFSLKLDSSYKFNGFSSGIKYAFIDHRDETVSTEFISLLYQDTLIDEMLRLSPDVANYSTTLDKVAGKKANDEWNDFVHDRKRLDQLDTKLQAFITGKLDSLPNLSREIAANGKFKLSAAAEARYKKIKENYNKKSLLTISISDTSYKDQFFFARVNTTLQYLKGLSDATNTNSTELDLKAALDFSDDSLKLERDLQRSIISVEPGVNFVIRSRGTEQSFFEFKLGGAYARQVGRIYPGEERNQTTLNATLRIRLIDDIWIPIEIKYDTKKQNFLGFLNVRANFKGLKKLLQN